MSYYRGNEPRAVARMERDGDFGHIFVYLVGLSEKWESESPINTYLYGSVKISGECNRSEDPYIYGIGVHYDVGSGGIRTREMEIAAVGMRDIDNKLENLSKKLGPARNYSEYVLRVLEVTGIEYIEVRFGDGQDDRASVTLNVRTERDGIATHLDALVSILLAEFTKDAT